MKKLFVMLSLGVLVAGSAFAQEAPKQERKVRSERVAGKDGVRKEARTPQERAAKRTEMLTKKYNLTQAQQAKLQALQLKHENEMVAKRADRATGATKDTNQRELKKAKHTQWETELQSIFTKEQYAQYQADKKAKMAGQRGKDGKKGRMHHRAVEQNKLQKS